MHHKKKTFREEYIELLKKYNVPFDEKYVLLDVVLNSRFPLKEKGLQNYDYQNGHVQSPPVPLATWYFYKKHRIHKSPVRDEMEATAKIFGQRGHVNDDCSGDDIF